MMYTRGSATFWQLQIRHAEVPTCTGHIFLLLLRISETRVRIAQVFKIVAPCIGRCTVTTEEMESACLATHRAAFSRTNTRPQDLVSVQARMFLLPRGVGELQSCPHVLRLPERIK